jgi:hypothetical protein
VIALLDSFGIRIAAPETGECNTPIIFLFNKIPYLKEKGNGKV